MRNGSVGKYLMTGCLLATGLGANLVHADWSVPPPKNYGRQGFGDFPPKDIDKLIEQENQQASSLKAESQKKEVQAKESAVAEGAAPASNSAEANNNYQPETAQGYTGQYYPVPNYGNYYGPRGGVPWDNRGTGFTTPWGNNGSSFSGPWNNRGSSFSMPWGNNGSGFTGPWDNNGSSFGPWGNRGWK